MMTKCRLFSLQILGLVLALSAGTAALANSATTPLPSATGVTAGVTATAPNPAAIGGVITAGQRALSASGVPPDLLNAPRADDITLKMIRQILGSPVDAALSLWGSSNSWSSGGVVTAVGGMLRIANFIAMIVGGLLILYVFVVGLLKTANEGEVLGKNWGTFWLPFRSTMAFGLVLPIPSFGGLGFVQIVVLALTLMGINIGSVSWDWAVQAMTNSPLVTIKTPDVTLGKQVLGSLVCMEAGLNNGGIDHPGWWKNGSGYAVPRIYSEDEHTRVDFGPGNRCGKLILVTHAASGQTGLQAALINSVGANTTRQFKQLIDTLAPLAHLLGTEGDFSKVTFSSFGTGRDAAAKYFRQSVDNFYRNMTVDAKNTLDRQYTQIQSQVVHRITDGGWALAGSYYWEMNRMQDDYIGAITGSVTDYEKPKGWDVIFGWGGGQMQKIYGRVMQDTGQFISDAEHSGFGGLDKTVDLHGGSWGAALAKGITKIVRYISRSSAANPDPMLEIHTLGNGIQDLAVAWLGAVAVSNTADKSLLGKVDPTGLVGGAAKAIGVAVSALLLPLVGLGFFCANLIPSMPFIMWMAAMIGVLVYVIEALTAAPFWAVMHATAQGDEVVGKGASGYPIIMALILRPFFMVLGLLSGMVIFRVGGWLANKVTFASFSVIGGGLSFNLFSVFGVLIVYTIILFMLAYKSFSLVHSLPNAVLRWFGGRDHEDLGEVEAHNQTKIFAGVATGRAQGFMSAAAQAGKDDSSSNPPSPSGGGGDAEQSRKSAVSHMGDTAKSVVRRASSDGRR